jgi:enoyl-CoA hydratase
LARAVGLRKGKEMTFTGNRVSANDALQMGLVNKVCPQAELLNEVMKSLEGVLGKGPIAVGVAKLAINQNWDMEIEEAQRNEAELFGELFATEDVREGTQAFVEKRKADFKGT